MVTRRRSAANGTARLHPRHVVGRLLGPERAPARERPPRHGPPLGHTAGSRASRFRASQRPPHGSRIFQLRRIRKYSANLTGSTHRSRVIGSLYKVLRQSLRDTHRKYLRWSRVVPLVTCATSASGRYTVWYPASISRRQ